MDLNPENEDSSSSSSSSSATSSKSEMSLLNEIWNTSSGSSAAASDILDFLSEDECTIENQPIRKERVCIKNYCEEVVPEYSDKKFLRQFRLERDTVNKLIIRYSQSKYCVVLNSGGRPPVSPDKQIYIFLWFVGHQIATYDEVQDKFDISPGALYHIINKVSDFLGEIAAEFIKWPSPEEIESTKNFYVEKYNFKDVVGVLDGTHLRIDRPPEQQDSYYNRKDFFSLQCQILCNHNYKILDFHLGYPGSVHDARVFRNSPLYERITTTNIGGYILGDSAYPCLRQLITPYKNNGHLQQKHRDFNTCLSKCRVSVENTIGQLKQRFRILYHIRLKPGIRRLKVIRACIVLHNMADENSLEHLEEPIEEGVEGLAAVFDDSSSESEDEADFDEDGFQVRDELCNAFANRNMH